MSRTARLAYWGAFAAAMLVWGLDHWPLRHALVNKGLLTACGVAVALVLRGVPARWPLVVAGCAAGSVVWLQAHELLFGLYYLAPAWGQAMRPAALDGGMLVLLFLVLIGWCALDAGLRRQQELLAARERADALARQARLSALRAQLEPHVLLNALNGVSTLILEGRGDDARAVLARLGDLLRRTLDTAGQAEIPLEEELHIVRAWLDVVHVRFGDRLAVEVDVDGDALPGRVPALVLQPLVENAVRHGALGREGMARVRVSGRRIDGRLRLEVEDDGPGLAPASVPGVGLTTTRARLAEMYGPLSSLDLAAAPGGGVRARVELPFRSAR
jgi:signal transduction histidine kinase